MIPQVPLQQTNKGPTFPDSSNPLTRIIGGIWGETEQSLGNIPTPTGKEGLASSKQPVHLPLLKLKPTTTTVVEMPTTTTKVCLPTETDSSDTDKMGYALFDGERVEAQNTTADFIRRKLAPYSFFGSPSLKLGSNHGLYTSYTRPNNGSENDSSDQYVSSSN